MVIQIFDKHFPVKFNFYFQIVSLILLATPCWSLAQEFKDFDIMKHNIEFMLPPLETIIDSAIAKNPYVKFRDLQIDINNSKLKGFKMDWTRNLGVQSDYLYGTFDNVSSNAAQGSSPAMLTTRSTQLNYGTGGFIRIPLYDLISRKNTIRGARAEVEQAKSYALEQRTELRQIVIKQYNDLIIKQRLLKIKIKYAETAKINMEMVQKQFLNGVVSLADYSSISESVARSEAELETSKMDFKTAYMILEEIVGIKFNLTSK